MGSILMFRFFFPPSYTLIRPPRLLILAKGAKGPVSFLCMKNRRQYLSRVLEKMSLRYIHVLRQWFQEDTITLPLYFQVFISGQILKL